MGNSGPMLDPKGTKLSTRLVHAGERAPAPKGRPTATPIYTTSSYVYDSIFELEEAFASGQGFTYQRSAGNPSHTQVERALMVAENAAGAMLFSSGMAALYAALQVAGTPKGTLVPKHRGIVAAEDLYGATLVQLNDYFDAQGVPVHRVDACDLAAVERALSQYRPTALLVEQISNPLLRVVDVATLAELAHRYDAQLIVDNTIATPILQQPLTEGADLVVHSMTKYLGGHADVVGGAIAVRDPERVPLLRRIAKTLGSVLGPFEANLIGRGIKTLNLRVRAQCDSALAVARFLENHPRIAKVHYPGLPSHPQHELASRCFGGRYGGLVSAVLADADRDTTWRFVDRFKLILPAVSLGDVYSLVTSPRISSHRDMSPEAREARGIPDSLLRFSVGIEDADDIIADLAQALDAN